MSLPPRRNPYSGGGGGSSGVDGRLRVVFDRDDDDGEDDDDVRAAARSLPLFARRSTPDNVRALQTMPASLESPSTSSRHRPRNERGEYRRGLGSSEQLHEVPERGLRRKSEQRRRHESPPGGSRNRRRSAERSPHLWEDSARFHPPVASRTVSNLSDNSVGRQVLPILNKIDLQLDIEARRVKRSTLELFPKAPSPAVAEEEVQAARILIISSKLPFTIIWSEDEGVFEIDRDPFELNIAALLQESGWMKSGPVDTILMGMPRVVRPDRSRVDINANEALQLELEAFLREDQNCVPVFASTRDRFADWMIWPLFHYSLPSCETGLGDSDYEGYELVNQEFRDAVLKEYRRGDLVWINDYPLMLLPKLLRVRKTDITIGFYLHCVFPSSEVYRILPQREEILRGVLSSNIVGFHNFEYMQQFLNSCIHILGLECSSSCIEACEDAGGTTTKVVTVPLGINIAPYQQLMAAETTRNRMAELEKTFIGKKLLVAVDRLEEKKGIPHKIMAFHKMLQRNPELASECVYLQIVESSGSNDEYTGEDEQIQAYYNDTQRLLTQVYQMVGEVNSKFGTIGHLPIHFLLQDFSKSDIVAVFAKAHVMIDTPLRDVLSRSAHEYLFCQEDGHGTLILSEFSGSAHSLRAASITVNPWATLEFADAILQALTREDLDFVELQRYGHKHVQEYTLKNWATNFLEELQTTERELESERLQIPPQLDHDKPVAALRKSGRRIIILGFAGTLVPHKSRLITKIHSKLPPVLLGNLQVLAEDPATELIIVSGLARDSLEQTLGSVPCWLIAEGGICYREPNSTEWVSSVEQKDEDIVEWMAPVKEIMEYFTARTPGSNVIEMEHSVSWLYQNTQGDHAAIQSKDLLVHLWAGPLLSAPAEVVVEKDCVTVRPTGIGQALQLEKLLHQICVEEAPGLPNKWFKGDTLVVCLGDFLMRDEDIFATVKNFFEAAPQAASQVEDEEINLWGVPTSIPEYDNRELQNLVTNSLSLGTGFNFTAISRLVDDDSPMGGKHDDSEGPLGRGLPKKLKKTPSEPGADFDRVGESDTKSDAVFRCGSEPDITTGAPVIFCCTVTKKATRAAHHLSDHNDVAFLIAQLAREVRSQAKAAAEFEVSSQCPLLAPDALAPAATATPGRPQGGRGGGAYSSLADLFAK